MPMAMAFPISSSIPSSLATVAMELLAGDCDASGIPSMLEIDNDGIPEYADNVSHLLVSH